MSDDVIYRRDAIDKIAHATFDVTIGGRRGFIDYKKEFEKAFVAIRDKYIEALESIPSVGSDIVCCEDCKYADDKPIADGRYWCELHYSYMYYCSDAERKKES